MGSLDVVITVSLFDFYDPTLRVAPYSFSYSPRWVPLGNAGYSWGYFSHKGKMLGYLFRDQGRWYAIKTCCEDLKDYGPSRDEAARYLTTSTHCTEPKCLARAWN